MLDIFLLIVLAWAVYDGWRDGFLREVVSAVGFMVGLLVAATCYSTLGQYLTVTGSSVNMMTSIVAFFILWIIVPIVLGMVAKVLTKALKGMHLGLPNSLLGVAVSLVKYLILLSCVLNVMEGLRILDESKTSTSYLYAPCKNALSWAFEHTQTKANTADTDSSSVSTRPSANDTVWVNMNNKPEKSHRKQPAIAKPSRHKR